jgi:PiT family inorganic phosphate transporter
MILLSTVVVAALIFDFVNGFHDAANAIATIVITKTLTPLQAVAMAGLANFLGYFTLGMAVAKTVGKGIVHIDNVTLPLLLAALLGAISWNIFTWIMGLPTSSSHALIGGLVGAGIAACGHTVVVWGGVLKIFGFIFLAPLIGFLGAAIFSTATIWIFRKSAPRKVQGLFKTMQLGAALLSSIGHGTNDAQKTMGVIALALYTAGLNPQFSASGTIPQWVVIAAYSAISLGTMFGGWRIVKTMGTGIAKIRDMEGFCANASSAFVLLGTAHFGIPVSTTHVISGTIMGVGSVKSAGSVRWVTARRILYAWFLTIPAAATVAAISFILLQLVNRG